MIQLDYYSFCPAGESMPDVRGYNTVEPAYQDAFQDANLITIIEAFF
jgi:hypothetical protein